MSSDINLDDPVADMGWVEQMKAQGFDPEELKNQMVSVIGDFMCGADIEPQDYHHPGLYQLSIESMYYDSIRIESFLPEEKFSISDSFSKEIGDGSWLSDEVPGVGKSSNDMEKCLLNLLQNGVWMSQQDADKIRNSRFML